AFALEHVARDREPVAGNGAAPADAGGAGVRGGAPGGIDDVQLPMRAAFVFGDEPRDDLRGRHPFGEKRETLSSPERIDERLGRERADPARRVRAERADGEELRRD